MVETVLDPEIEARLLAAQKNEITEYFIYEKLAQSAKDTHNRDILRRISRDELKHHNIWKGHTGKKVQPHRWKIRLFYFIAKVFGITFGLKLMERGEGEAQINYGGIAKYIRVAEEISRDEHEHENKLLSLINEERLQYIGAIIRGLNEGLVELTGAMAGLTFAFQNSSLIATTGLIIGLAMSLSLGSTEYLATKSEESGQHPLKAAAYTGFANAVTVLLLIIPFLVFDNIYTALGLMLLIAIIIIFVFSFYISVTKETSLKSRFVEMASISLGIAAVTFTIGFLARTYFHIEI
jgi:VIT1/CCC1 family predicted Fe2+/Mn2+ transporter